MVRFLAVGSQLGTHMLGVDPKQDFGEVADLKAGPTGGLATEVLLPKMAEGVLVADLVGQRCRRECPKDLAGIQLIRGERLRP